MDAYLKWRKVTLEKCRVHILFRALFEWLLLLVSLNTSNRRNLLRVFSCDSKVPATFVNKNVKLDRPNKIIRLAVNTGQVSNILKLFKTDKLVKIGKY